MNAERFIGTGNADLNRKSKKKERQRIHVSGLESSGLLALTVLFQKQMGTDRFAEILAEGEGVEGMLNWLNEEGRHVVVFDGKSELLKDDEAYQQVFETLNKKE